MLSYAKCTSDDVSSFRLQPHISIFPKCRCSCCIHRYMSDHHSESAAAGASPDSVSDAGDVLEHLRKLNHATGNKRPPGGAPATPCSSASARKRQLRRSGESRKTRGGTSVTVGGAEGRRVVEVSGTQRQQDRLEEKLRQLDEELNASLLTAHFREARGLLCTVFSGL